MKYFVALLLAVLAIAFHSAGYVVGLASAARVLTPYAADAWAPVVAGTVEFAKAALLASAGWFMTRRGASYRTVAAALAIAWIVVVGLSALATKATVTSTFDTAEFAGGRTLQREADIKKDLAAAEGRLELMGTPRPAYVVAADVERMKIARAFTTSAGCTAVSGAVERAHCDRYLALMAEQAAAQGADRERDTIRRLRAELRGVPHAVSKDPLVAAWDASVGAWIDISGRSGIGAAVVLLVELMSCISLSAVGLALGWREASSEGMRETSANSPPLPEAAQLRHEQPLPEAPLEQVVEPLPNLSPAPMIAGCAAREGAHERAALPTVSEPSPTPANDDKGEGSSSVRGTVLTVVGSHVPRFVAECVERSVGETTAGADFIAAYGAWCAARGERAKDWQVVARELLGLGFEKRKSRGVMVWQNVRVRAGMRKAS